MLKLTGETSYANHIEIIVEPKNWSKRPSTDHILTQIIKDHFTFWTKTPTRAFCQIAC